MNESEVNAIIGIVNELMNLGVTNMIRDNI